MGKYAQSTFVMSFDYGLKLVIPGITDASLLYTQQWSMADDPRLATLISGSSFSLMSSSPTALDDDADEIRWSVVEISPAELRETQR
jgi:hypothetical protein